MKYNCGITGHTGVLGSEFTKIKNIKFIKFKGDLTKKKDITKWLNKNEIDYIFHFAAIVPTRIVKNNPNYANQVNHIGTKNLVDEILKQKNVIKWFFFSSTSHVYKFSKKKISERSVVMPTSQYGLTKLKAENYIIRKFKKNNVPFCIGRIFSFTHKNQSTDFVVPNIINKVKNKKKIIYFKNTNHYRDLISVDDICSAIRILFKKKAQGIYNIGTGKRTLISDIVKIVFRKFKKKFLIEHNYNQTALIANISKMKKIGWRPSKTIRSIISQLV